MKKKVLLIGIVSGTLAVSVAAAAVIASKNFGLNSAKVGADVTYTLTIDTPLYEGEGTSGVGTKVFKTDLGNDVKIQYSGLSAYQQGYSPAYPTGMNCINVTDGYVAIVANDLGHGVAGIRSVKFYLDNDTSGNCHFVGEYGWADGVYVGTESYQLYDSTHEKYYYFDDLEPTFAKFTSDNGATRIGIHQIDITYTCVETVSPFATFGDFDLVKRPEGWNVLGYNGTSTSISFPSQYNSEDIVAIHDDFALTAIDKTDVVEITIPSQYNHIGDNAFEGYTNLPSVTLPSALEYIGVSAFEGCSSLGTVTIPEGVVIINDNAFYNCDSITAVNIPSTVEIVGRQAFDSCNNAASLTFAMGGTKDLDLGNQCFRGNKHSGTLTLPKRISSLGQYSFTDMENVTAFAMEDNDNTGSFRCIDGVLYAESGRRLHDFPKKSLVTNFTVPTTVTVLNDYEAFSCCQTLESVTFSNTDPDTTFSINSYVFESCPNLMSVTFSTGKTELRHYPFSGCNFRSIVIPTNVFVNYNGLANIGEAGDPLNVYAEATSAGAAAWDSSWDGGEVAAGKVNVYYYSESSSSGCWHYVAGVPTLW